MMAKTLTPDQAKKKLEDQGVTVRSWAIAHGYKPHAVYQVLNNLTKAKFGIAHQIAIDLGIKAAPDQSAA